MNLDLEQLIALVDEAQTLEEVKAAIGGLLAYLVAKEKRRSIRDVHAPA